MNEDDQMEIVREGELAKVLLESEAFVTTIADLKNVWNVELDQPAPSDYERREELYRLHLALEHIEAVLASRATATDLVTAMQAEEQEEDDTDA